MVEPTFLAVVVGVFLVLLVVILRSGDKQQGKTAKNQREKPTKPQKAKKSSKRPNKRVIENPLAFTPIQGAANNENDAKEILEFLKGKDPNEAAKQYANQQKQQQQQQQQQQQAGNKKRKAKNEPAPEESRDSHAKGSEEGFTVIKKEKKEKKETKEKKENEGEEPKKGKKSKRFYKAGIVDAELKDKDQKARGRKKRKQDEETGVPTSEEPEEEGKRKNNKPQTEGQQPDSENKPRRERRERKEGESESDGKERKEGEKRRDGPPPPGRRAFTAAAPTVKYEPAALDDILQSISTSYQPKSKGVRHHTLFSKLSRTLVLQILSKLEAKDIVALSRVNHFFLNISKRDDIWEALAKRDFGIKELGKYRNFKAAYRGEYTKRRSQKRREEREKKNPKKEEIPKDDLKDKKGKKEEKKEEVADE